MSYLISSDYKKQIQAGNLAEVIRSDQTIQTAAENTAIEEASSYLVQKYDLTSELQDTPAWNSANSYLAGNRVFLNPPAYNPATAYSVGQYVTYLSNVYKCNTGTTGTWTPASWTLVGPQCQIFSAVLPQPLFNLQGYYQPPNPVFWKNNTYICQIKTRSFAHSTILQFENLTNIPYSNVFPDDVNYGPTYWGAPTPYSIPINTDILNTTYWSPTDNRCQQLVTYLIDIALYHMHAAIAPRNIPDLRVKRYDDAIAWLRKASLGQVTAALPVLQPRQGSRNRYGGQIKNDNSW